MRQISSPRRSGFSFLPCSTSTLMNKLVRFMVPYTYTKEMACVICETRRPKRFCPGVRGDICAICCGTEREVTVDCPLDCEYLIESRRHDKAVELTGADLPNRDIEVSEGFLRDNEVLLVYLCGGLLKAAMETPGVVDYDVREALESLIRTYRTLQSGVYYESRPANPMALAVYDAIQRS